MAKQNKPSLGTTIRQNSSGVLAALMCIVIGLVIGFQYFPFQNWYLYL